MSFRTSWRDGVRSILNSKAPYGYNVRPPDGRWTEWLDTIELRVWGEIIDPHHRPSSSSYEGRTQEVIKNFVTELGFNGGRPTCAC